MFKVELTRREIPGHEHHMDLAEIIPKKVIDYEEGGLNHFIELTKYYQNK
jgi:hypothetical protein